MTAMDRKMAFKLQEEMLRVQAEHEKLQKLNCQLEVTIEERKRAEELAARYADFRERVFNSIDAALAVVMPDGVISEVNEAWRRFALENNGTDESTWGKGANYFREARPEFGDTTSALEAYEGLRCVQRGEKEFFTLEYACHSPSKKRWFIMRVMPLKGWPGTVLVSHTDITDRVQGRESLDHAVDALRASETLFRNVFEHHTAVKLLLDPATGKILDANEAAVAYYGWTKEQLLRMRITDINTLPPAEVKAELEKARGLRRTHFEFRHRRADGSVRDVAVFSSNIGTGEMDVLHSIVIDITDRKRAETEREEALAAVQRQLQEKDLLLRETHHRIKNNITSIQTLLSMQARETADPGALSALQDAAGRVAGMRVLYDRMLMADRYQEVGVSTYLGGLVDSVVGLLAGETHVVVERRFDDITLNSKVLFPLGLIVNEIVTNMIKHAFAGRECGTIRVGVTQEGKRVTVVLGDDGEGLPPGFDIGASKGFGLTLVRMLCQQLEAELTVDSCGGGTRWTLVFNAE